MIFRQGAGHVQPNDAADPGLVFDSGFADWLSFICGVQPGWRLHGVTPIDPSNLNVASIAIGDLAGVQTVTRRVTNVGDQAETYTASYTGLAGITVALPVSFTIAKGRNEVVRRHVHDGRRCAEHLRWRTVHADRRQGPCRAHSGRHSAGGACGADAGQRVVQRDVRLHRTVHGDGPRAGTCSRVTLARSRTIRRIAPARWTRRMRS